MSIDLLAPRSFARGWAAILVALVVVGITMEFVSSGSFLPGFLDFDWTHDFLHIGLLGLALFMGFRASDSLVRLYARVFGVGGLVIATLGFVPALHDVTVDLTGMHLEVGENVVHALLGLWGIVAGFRPLPPSVQAGPSGRRRSAQR